MSPELVPVKIEIQPSRKLIQRVFGRYMHPMDKVGVQLEPELVKRVLREFGGKVWFEHGWIDNEGHYWELKRALTEEIRAAAERRIEEAGRLEGIVVSADDIDWERLRRVYSEARAREAAAGIAEAVRGYVNGLREKLRTFKARNALEEETKRLIEEAARRVVAGELTVDGAADEVRERLAEIYSGIREQDTKLYIEELEKRVRELEEENERLRQRIAELNEEIERLSEGGEEDEEDP